MSFIKFLLSLAGVLLIYASLVAQTSNHSGHDCFSVLVGKDASEDGSVLFAHNEDDWGERLVNWYKVPALNHREAIRCGQCLHGVGLEQWKPQKIIYTLQLRRWFSASLC